MPPAWFRAVPVRRAGQQVLPSTNIWKPQYTAKIWAEKSRKSHIFSVGVIFGPWVSVFWCGCQRLLWCPISVCQKLLVVGGESEKGGPPPRHGQGQGYYPARYSRGWPGQVWLSMGHTHTHTHSMGCAWAWAEHTHIESIMYMTLNKIVLALCTIIVYTIHR